MIPILPDHNRLLFEILQKHAPHLDERAFGDHCDYTLDDYLTLAAAVSKESAGCDMLLQEIERFISVIENPPTQGLQKIRNEDDVLAFYNATNGLHDGEGAFVDLCGDTLRIGVVVTSIAGRPIAQMVFRGVKDWQFKRGYVFYSNIAFEDGGVIWTEACRFDNELLKTSDYVRATSMEWVIQ